jgi:hypothetical protein
MNLISTIRVVIGRLIRHRRDLAVLGEAVVWLLLAWSALKWLPFRRVALLLRPTCRAVSVSPGEIARVRWAVVAAARRVPWRAVCFHQGIAAQRMLCRRGIVADLHYGVARTGDGLIGHVWVTAGAVIVVGGAGRGPYTLMTTFSAVRQDRSHPMSHDGGP